MIRRIPCQIPVRIAAFAVAALIAAPAAWAHEVQLLDRSWSDELRVLPLVVPGAHLSFSTPSLAFGGVIVGEESTLSLNVTNATAGDTLSVQVSVANSQVRLSASSWTLTPGQTAALSVTYAPTVAGSLSTDLRFSSAHAGVSAAFEEVVALTGQGLAPPSLVLRNAATGQVVQQVDFAEFPLGLRPSTELELANVGDAPLPSNIVVSGVTPLTDLVLNPWWFRSCSADGATQLCVFEPGFNSGSSWELGERLAGLPGGGTLPLTFEMLTDAADEFSFTLDIDYAPYGALTTPVIGEVTPYDPEPAPSGSGGTTLTGTESGGDYVINTSAEVLARGLGVDNQFSGTAKPDLINLLNGNLTLGIPIGGSYPVGGTLSYSLSLRYNSNVWDFWNTLEEPTGWATVYRPQLDATAGVGWSFHLGRLCEPLNIPYFRGLTPAQRRKLMCRDDRWHYIDASGAVHFFRGDLHGTASAAIQERDELYTSDGSYIRMARLSSLKRELQFPDGSVHTYEKKTSWGDGWLDPWRLTEIRDRNGNALSIDYKTTRDDSEFGNQWELNDGHRTHIIRFRADPTGYYPRLVDEVDLAAFGGTRAEYTFSYADVTVPSPWDGHIDPGLNVRVPLLEELGLPDGTSYQFTYYEATTRAAPSVSLRAESVTLPTGGKVEWSYSTFTSPSPIPCISVSEAPHLTALLGVGKRTVKDADGSVLDIKQFRQKLYRTSLHNYDYCGPAEGEEPYAESVTASVAALSLDGNQNPTANAVTLHYFSVLPLNELPPGAPAGYTGHESGLPFTREQFFQETTGSAKEFLSTRVYDCGAIDVSAQPNPKLLVSGCGLLRSEYVTYGRSPDWTHDVEVAAGPVNPRRTSGRTLFHDDLQEGGASHWVATKSSGFDGLGHFRTRETTASFGASRYEERYTNYNPGAGNLISDGSGITQNITLPSVWVLDAYHRHWVQGSRWTGTASSMLPKRGSQRCWTIEADRLTLDRERTWEGSNPGAGDIIIRNTYTNGDLTKQEYFGSDKQTVPTGNGLCSVNLGALSPQSVVDHTYASGSLKTSKTAGASFFSADRDIDANTGLVKAERDIGGIQTDFKVDSVGRTTEAKHAVDATRVFTFKLPGVDAVTTPEVTVKDHVRGAPANVLTEVTVMFDGLGRVAEEKEKRPGGESRRRLSYWPRGWLRSASTWQDTAVTFTAAWKTEYTYDALGRPLSATAPDGSVQTMSYTGARLSVFETWIGTTYDTSQTHDVKESKATYTRTLDPFGRVEQVVTPKYTQTFQFDSLGSVTQTTRTQGGASQSRSFTWDGRGFLLSETHPELSSTTYTDFDVFGREGKKTDGAGTLRFRYNAAGQLRFVDEAVGQTWRILRELTYYPAGTVANGRLKTATRRHYLTAENTAYAFPGTEGLWMVTEESFYGADGRVSSRQTQVTDNNGGYPANFRQTWTWSPLGNVASQTHPGICGSTFGSTCAAGRTTTYSYTWGRLAAVSPGGALGATLTYHPNGQLHQVNHDNGQVDVYGKHPQNMARVWSISLANGSKNLGVHRYDSSGNLIRIGPHRYTYDLVARLKEHYQSGTRKDWFSYDAFDNLSHIKGVSQGTSTVTNRLTTETFDADGRQETDGCADLHYDPLDLVRTYAVDSSQSGCPAGNPTWTYLYNASDQRILTAGTGVGFQWELRDLGGKLLSTFKNAGSGLTRVKDYVYRGGRVLASREAGETRHLHLDHLGTPRAISTAGGTVLIRDLTPYGEPIGSDHGEEIQFTGHQRDVNDETTYMLARTYDGGRGRFLSADPARDGWNLYAYAGNNPLNLIDPTGLSGKGVNDPDPNDEEVDETEQDQEHQAETEHEAEEHEEEEIGFMEWLWTTNPVMKTEKIVFFTIGGAGTAIGGTVGGVSTMIFDTVLATPLAVFIPGMEDKLEMSMSQPGFYLPATDKLAEGLQEGFSGMLEAETEVVKHGGWTGFSSDHHDEEEP